MPKYAQDKAVVVPVETFRQHADIQQKVMGTIGTRGERNFTWTTIYPQEPMAIKVLTGRALELAKQLTPNATHECHLRYKVGITAIEWRINFGTQTLGVEHVANPDYRNRQLILTCRAQSQQGDS